MNLVRSGGVEKHEFDVLSSVKTLIKNSNNQLSSFIDFKKSPGIFRVFS